MDLLLSFVQSAKINVGKMQSIFFSLTPNAFLELMQK